MKTLPHRTILWRENSKSLLETTKILEELLVFRGWLCGFICDLLGLLVASEWIWMNVFSSLFLEITSKNQLCNFQWFFFFVSFCPFHGHLLLILVIFPSTTWKMVLKFFIGFDQFCQPPINNNNTFKSVYVCVFIYFFLILWSLEHVQLERKQRRKRLLSQHYINQSDFDRFSRKFIGFSLILLYFCLTLGLHGSYNFKWFIYYLNISFNLDGNIKTKRTKQIKTGAS